MKVWIDPPLPGFVFVDDDWKIITLLFLSAKNAQQNSNTEHPTIFWNKTQLSNSCVHFVRLDMKNFHAVKKRIHHWLYSLTHVLLKMAAVPTFSNFQKTFLFLFWLFQTPTLNAKDLYRKVWIMVNSPCLVCRDFITLIAHKCENCRGFIFREWRFCFSEESRREVECTCALLC